MGFNSEFKGLILVVLLSVFKTDAGRALTRNNTFHVTLLMACAYISTKWRNTVTVARFDDTLFIIYSVGAFIETKMLLKLLSSQPVSGLLIILIPNVLDCNNPDETITKLLL